MIFGRDRRYQGGRGPAKNAPDTEPDQCVTCAGRVRQASRERPKERLTALSHDVTVDLLQDAYAALRREAAPGANGVTWSTYERIWRPISRIFINGFIGEHIGRSFRSDGAYRSPMGKCVRSGIASLEDKIVQKAVVEILNAIYEEEFLGFSYGFRP